MGDRVIPNLLLSGSFRRRGVVLGVAVVTVAVAAGGFAMLGGGGSSGSKGIGRPGVGGTQSSGSSGGNAANSGNGGSSGGSGPTPHVPHNNKVNIYNLFGLHDVDKPILDGLIQRFDSEGYKITKYEDTTEGAGSQGGATLANFVGMAKQASVIIINAHGIDFSGAEQSCTLTSGKGLSVCSKFIDPTLPTTTTTVPATTTTTKAQSLSPTLQVEWYPTWAAERVAYRQYLASGYNASWLFDPSELAGGRFYAATLIPARPGDLVAVNQNGTIPKNPYGARPWLGITAAGIAHFFKDAKIDLIDNMACHSIALATSFNARSYFGHASTACAGFEAKDEPTLFDRLIGKSDVPARPTTKAFALGGFVDKYFQLADNAQPIVLSPAVEAVTPKENARIKRAMNTRASVVFDAVMDQTGPDDIVTIRGCDGKIQNAKWSNDHTLAFDIAVPKSPTTTLATLTIHNDRAKAEPGNAPNHDLDGNQQPVAFAGQAPNRDDYTWQVFCGTGIVVEVRDTGSLQTDYSDSINGNPWSYHVRLRWDIRRVWAVDFSGLSADAPLGPGTMIETGSATSTKRPGSGADPPDDCHWNATPRTKPSVYLQHTNTKLVNGVEAYFVSVSGGPNVNTNWYPGNTDVLAVSGSCHDYNRVSPVPYTHKGIGNVPLDPKAVATGMGGIVGAAANDIAVTSLAQQPFVQTFPLEYTQSTGSDGGSEHVVSNSTLTVTRLG